MEDDKELERIRKNKLKELMNLLRIGGGEKKKETGEVKKVPPEEIEVNADDTNFKEAVIEKSKEVPVVVDFWAAWCGPCRMIGPVLEKLAKEYNGRFVLAKVNVEVSRRAAMAYGIRSIPAVKMFKNGAVVSEFVGALPEHMIRQWLEENL